MNLFRNDPLSTLRMAENDNIVGNDIRLVIQYLESAEGATREDLRTWLVTDRLANLFTSKGLDENHEPNAFGLRIEALIDSLLEQDG